MFCFPVGCGLCYVELLIGRLVLPSQRGLAHGFFFSFSLLYLISLCTLLHMHYHLYNQSFGFVAAYWCMNGNLLSKQYTWFQHKSLFLYLYVFVFPTLDVFHIFTAVHLNFLYCTSLLKCPTLLRDHCLVDFISHGHSSSLKASFESE
jgi:cellulose synthase/poly-beta-1,6-N-acetylglucosamine synthase-like glycosyltransferase